MLYIDKKYANLLGSRLEKFQWKSTNLANFRCPLCGDSETQKNKKRGYIYEHNGKMKMKCHNCGQNMGFSFFLRTVDSVLYKEYRMEKFIELGRSKKTEVVTKKPIKTLKEEPKSIDLSSRNDKILNGLVSLESLKDVKDNLAIASAIHRQIPIERWNDLYFTDNYMAYCYSLTKDERYKDDRITTDPRLVIPFRDKKGNIFALQGRDLSNNPKSIRYLTVELVKSMPLIYGIDRVDFKKPVYVVEGPIDSMFIPNSLAVAGAYMHQFYKADKDIIFIHDNQPRNKEVCASIQKSIDSKKKVVIFPENVLEKDINDMILSGIDIESLISKNTYQGMKAIIQFNKWKKI